MKCKPNPYLFSPWLFIFKWTSEVPLVLHHQGGAPLLAAFVDSLKSLAVHRPRLFSLWFVFPLGNKLLITNHWSSVKQNLLECKCTSLVFPPRSTVLQSMQWSKKSWSFWSLLKKKKRVGMPPKELLPCACTSALHQTRGCIPTVPDDRAVVDLLNHSTHTHGVEKMFQQT